MTTRLTLKPNEERRLLRGHLWAFRTQFAEEPKAADGAVVDIRSSQGKQVGRGFFQREGGIAVRILDRHQTDIDAGFLEKRVSEAMQMRSRLFPGSRVYRWIHGESDGLPGLIADRYDTVVSAQSTCAFYADVAEPLIAAFLKQDGVEGVRLSVGDQVHTAGSVAGDLAIEVEGLKYNVPFEEGQKTGFFLDQRLNARVMDVLAPGMRVLDGHCYAGQWSLRAAQAGAAEVIGVDTSAAAIEQAKANAALNGIGGALRFEQGDVEARLQTGEQFDVICLDPPALAKSRGSLPKAQKRYQSLNRDAMKCLRPGGYLVTSSCSHPVDEGVFLELLKRAARSAQRQALILERRGAPADHPILMTMPETGYLNCIVLRVL